MALPIRKVTPDGLLDLIGDTVYALVRVDRLPTIEMHPGVADFFANAWPGLTGAATLCRSDVRDPAWWDDVFRTAVGPIRNGVKDGYYLFESRLVVGNHNGVIRPAYAYDPEMAAQSARVKKFAFRDRDVPAEDLEAARQIASYFDGLIARKQHRSEARHEGGYVIEERERAGPKPPSPYEVLGLATTASDDEVKAAYREHIKGNHPDRVAHLSKALQAFALAQTLAIQQAYDEIRARRDSGA